MSANCFVHLLVHRPFLLLIVIASISLLCFVIPFYNQSLPNFTEPTKGFETRGTDISQRLITWKNFYEASEPPGTLTGNAKEYLFMLNASKATKTHIERKKIKQRKRKLAKKNRNGKKSMIIHGTVVTEERDLTNIPTNDKWKRLNNLLQNSSSDMPMRIEGQKAFCGPPDDKYVQFVLKSSLGKEIFTLDAFLSLCHIEKQLTSLEVYPKLCLDDEFIQGCCRPWSLPNYIALLSNRQSCLSLTEQDVLNSRQLISMCMEYYQQELLDPKCSDSNDCISVPFECRQYDAVYTILHFLASATYSKNESRNSNTTSTELNIYETIIFLPMAKSIASLEYYYSITNLNYKTIAVVGIDMGAKNELFEEILIHDTMFMLLGACFVMICLWVYTGSLFLTLMTILAMTFSLGISYFIYVYIFQIHFFPFMNMMAVVVIIGIGADDAFIFCKYWHYFESTSPDLLHRMQITLSHASISMFVTSFTTAIAFFTSYFSSITAIRCFGLFAATAIVMNYLLMVTWLPVCVIIGQKALWNHWKIVYCDCFQSSLACNSKQWRSQMPKLGIFNFPEDLVTIIIRYKYLHAICFTFIAAASFCVVFCYPKLQIRHSSDLQLFETRHLFEQYDIVYKAHFDFKKSLKAENLMSLHYPMRIVWGLRPIDNGDFLDPKQTGTISFDPSFNISAPGSQEWLLSFCHRVREQAFYYPSQGTFLTNCFIETFVSWMNRSCIDPFDIDINRYPCCNESAFPYTPVAFETCIIDAQNDLYHTPPTYLLPSKAGLQFTKTGTPQLAVLVVEFDSNCTYSATNDDLEHMTNAIQEWLRDQLVSAPEGLRRAFFISDLEFFDLQRELPRSTILAVAISMPVAFLVLVATTRSLLGSLVAIFTIMCSIVTILALLVLLGWKLSILESVAISSTIGFTVDYSLHYIVNYKADQNRVRGESREIIAARMLIRMLGPTSMGAMTTGAAGAFMLISDILAYQQIGQFLLIVTSVSWLFATFQLGSLMAIVGAEGPNEGQYYFWKAVSISAICNYRLAQGRSHEAVSDTVDPSEVDNFAVRFDNAYGVNAEPNVGRSISEMHQCNASLDNNASPSHSAITFITTD